MRSQREKEKGFTFLPPVSQGYGEGQRHVGGKSTVIAKVTKKQVAPPQASMHASVQKIRNRDPGAPLPPLTSNDLEMGVLACIERGLLPHNFDLGSMISQNGSAPLSSGSAALHQHIDQFKRQEIMTANMGFGSVMNVKLDLKAIEKIPMQPQDVEIPLKLPVASVPNASVEAPSTKERDDARTYTELLDMYSLHEFIIRKGQTLRNTPEFVSYQRSFAVQWGAISLVISHLERLLTAFGIQLAYIDGKKVAALASVDLGVPTKEELLNCVANRAEVEPQMVSLTQQFKQGSQGHHAAATKIQSMIKMWKQKGAYEHLKAATHAALRIQHQWSVHKAHMKTRKAITALREGMIFRWRETMDQFVRDWPRIKCNRRLIVHLPSLSYPAFQCKTIPFYECFQAAQMMRLADLQDPDVDIILVAPFRIEEVALQYYYNTLKLAGAVNPEKRVQLLVPEHAKRLPPNLSLTKIVLMSSKMMKCLASLVKGKVAYIVPGVVSNDELTLAAKLNLPLLSAEPKVAQVLGTKSGAKSIFESAEVVPPIGAYHVKDEQNLYIVLARFIAEYHDVPRWLVKIDTESGSRGHAYFDVSRFNSVKTYGNVAAEHILSELRESAAKRVKIVNSLAYPDWASFLRVFDTVGGCVEAVPKEVVAHPTANLFIEPDGTVHLKSVFEQVFSPLFSVLGSSFPQTSTPHEAIRDAALNIGTAAFRRKIMGYLSVDFVVHERVEPDGKRVLRLWAVDLDLHLTTNACIHEYVSLLTNSEFNAQTGECLAHSPSGIVSPLTYLYSGLIYNPYIGAIRHANFFNTTCRKNGLAFDLQRGQGVVFHLVDTLLKGCFGAITIHETKSACVALLSKTQQVLQSEIPKDPDSILESNYGHFVNAVRNLGEALGKSSKKKGL